MHHHGAQQGRGGDRAVAALAAEQYGVVSLGQLRAAGLGRGAVALRIRNGRLHRQHRGVYAVGHPRLEWRGRLWAAVLAGGGVAAAAVSHRSAAELWGFWTTYGRIDISTTSRVRPSTEIRVHRRRILVAEGLDDGLPVTTPARTLVDLAAVLDAHRLERACHRAEHARLLDVAAIGRILAETRQPGARALRAALGALGAREPAITRSELEERFLVLIARAGLPRPLVNVSVLGFEVDFFWPELRLVVETDGMATHLTAAAFQRDRRRDTALTLAGYRVLRFTWRDVVDDAPRVVAALRCFA